MALLLNYTLYDERWWSEILLSIITTPGHALQVNVTDLDILYSNLEMFFVKAFRDNFSLIIDRFTSILPQVTGNGLNSIQYHPNST